MDATLFAIISAVAAFAATGLMGFWLIPWLRKLNVGQTILDIGPKWHKGKESTPTMGGLMFIFGTVVAVLIGLLYPNSLLLSFLRILREDSTASMESGDLMLIPGIFMALGFAAVGFLDDYIKVVKKRNEGLKRGEKTILQVLIISGFLLALWFINDKAPQMWIPFAGKITMPYWAFFPFGFGVLFCATNAVNFTDGIDGLCSSVTATVAAAFLALAYLAGESNTMITAAALLGGCIGFFAWNKKPAKIFMGDTGSMFLGGMVIALAYALDVPIILLFFGLVYVIEGLSDVIQIAYYKATKDENGVGKRIFKMVPIHHHFEMIGWSEVKIVVVFTLVNILGIAAGFFILRI
ncbi:MAG: phospho-N-acetylmuramoyl-pentapeptide-transferase [Oscillospiraceae bacterium]|nr:phospho-N-acetylmuramoyl-pentapeptide-transferase [Oscillospiraceae bacterium]